MAEHLPSKLKTLDSISSTRKKKKDKIETKEWGWRFSSVVEHLPGNHKEKDKMKTKEGAERWLSS